METNPLAQLQPHVFFNIWLRRPTSQRIFSFAFIQLQPDGIRG
jgi:hypothetical protein